MTDTLNCISNMAVLANAGYGKTQWLGNRILGLLLLDGGNLSGIMAASFTKPAADEILQRILDLLLGAITDEKKRSTLKSAVEQALDQTGNFKLPDELCSRDNLLKLLRHLLEELPRLNISTLDSFFCTLINCFPFELGLPGDLCIITAAEVKEEKRRIVNQILNDNHQSSSESRKRALNALRMFLLGKEQKHVYQDCLDFLSIFAGQSELGAAVNPENCKIELPAANAKRLNICREIAKNWLLKQKAGENKKNLLAAMIDDCANSADDKFPRFTSEGLETLKKFAEIFTASPEKYLRTGADGFKQKFSYSGEEVIIALHCLVKQGILFNLKYAAGTAAAALDFYQQFRRRYEKQLFAAGKLSFSDLPVLLAGSRSDLDETRQIGLEDLRYRTNSDLKHILLDEFQDTSRSQWRALEPITGDNGEGDHSLALVGDVKQAIYGWRGGDWRLFNETAVNMDKFNLPYSYRYGEVICQEVNQLFNYYNVAMLDNLTEEKFRRFVAPGEKLSTQWEKSFSLHQIPPERSGMPGRFSARAFVFFKYSATPAEVEANFIVERLTQLDFGNGPADYTAAVLVRDAAGGIAIRDALYAKKPEWKQQDLVIWEGDESIEDEALVHDILIYLIALHHPADTQSAAMSQVNDLLGGLFPRTEADFQRQLQILERGFAPFLEYLLGKLATSGISGVKSKVLQRFFASSPSVSALLNTARRFDAASPRGDALDFANLVRETSVRGREMPGKLRILTMHRSKGLTFDLVFVPEDHSQGAGGINKVLGKSGGDLLNFTAPDGTAKLLYKFPLHLLSGIAEIAAENPEFANIIKSYVNSVIDKDMEKLSLLYVAITRARYETMVFLPLPGSDNLIDYLDGKEKYNDCDGIMAFKRKENQGIYLRDWIIDSLFMPGLSSYEKTFTAYPSGKSFQGYEYVAPQSDANWLDYKRGKSKKTVNPAEQPLGLPAIPAVSRTEISRVIPSRAQEEQPQLSFQLPDDRSLIFGSALHKFFESMERPASFVPPPETGSDLLEHLENCLRNPEIADLLNDDAAEIWRERPFDVLLDDSTMVTGTFDRVQLKRNIAGELQSAVILDFKSNRFKSANNAGRQAELAGFAQKYQSQLDIYRQVLAKLTGLAPANIRCALIFTSIGEIRYME